ELKGVAALNLFHEADRAAAQHDSEKCLEQPGRSQSSELRMIRKDGSTLCVRKNCRAMPVEGGPVLLIACEDITDQKRAEALTAQVFERAPDGICIVERDYRYRRANAVYAQRWGMTPEQVVGRHVAELLGADAFEHVIKPKLDRCFAGEEVLFEWIS